MKATNNVLPFKKFLAWAKAKPQDEVFNYLRGIDGGKGACPIAQYLAEAGYQDVRVYGDDFKVGDGEVRRIPQPIHSGLERLIANPGVEFTFAQLVTALEGTQWL